jgi:tol-pal system protein YbgF
MEADISLRVDTLQSQTNALSTNVDEYKDYLNRPSKEIGRVKEDVDARIKFLEERGKTLEERNRANDEKIKGLEERFKTQEAKASAPPPKPPEAETTLPTREGLSELKGVSAGMGDLYKDAYDTFQKGNLEEARRKFEAFLKQYPNTELSDNAQFWIGETYYLKKQFDKAILEYEKAIVKYPEGDKIPAATLKQALSFWELGDKTNARNLLKRVIERYPRSDQADLAKKKLETLK